MRPAVMGTGPEFDGIFFPSCPGYVPEVRSAIGVFLPWAGPAASPDGKASPVIDKAPEWDGIILPSTLGWVLMTAGYSPF